jgi:hypothetical protein
MIRHFNIDIQVEDGEIRVEDTGHGNPLPAKLYKAITKMVLQWDADDADELDLEDARTAAEAQSDMYEARRWAAAHHALTGE